jgi:hypothetical protein
MILREPFVTCLCQNTYKKIINLMSKQFLPIQPESLTSKLIAGIDPMLPGATN